MERKEIYQKILNSYDLILDKTKDADDYKKVSNELKLCYSLMDAYFLTESILMHTKSSEYSELHKNAMKNYEIQLNIILNGWKT